MRRSWVIYYFFATFLLTACTSNSRPDADESEKEADLYLQMGARYLEIGKTDVALERLNHSLQLNPDNSATHDVLAVLYEQIEDDSKARYHFEQSIELSPNNPATENNYGRFLCTHGDYEKGMQYLNSAISMPLNTRKWFAYTNAGICEYQHGNKQNSEQFFREALQLQPAYAPALLEMMQISYENGKYMSARAFLERYQEVAKHTPRTLMLAMKTEQALGNQEQADEYKGQLLEKFPASVQAREVRNTVQQ